MKNINNKTIVFIVGLLSQPRCIKRINSFYNNGYICKVYGYNRGNYDINKYPKDIEVHQLSVLKDGRQYLKKLRIIKDDVRQLIEKYPKYDTVFYSFGFIQTFFLNLYHKRYIYEISDILYAYPKFRYIEWILKYLDKKLIKQSYLTIMTSMGFKKYFGLYADNIIVQPNKVSSYFKDYNRTESTIVGGRIRFGFVGAMRYDSILRFAEVIGVKYPQYQFIFYGGNTDIMFNKCQLLVNKYPNIEYHGKFKSPEDLVELYSHIDVVVACYDIKSKNEKIAEPNKLYDSLLFCKPIVVSQNTFLAEQVVRLKCGYVVDATSSDSIINFVEKININDLNKISKNDLLISLDDIVDNSSSIMNFIKEHN